MEKILIIDSSRILTKLIKRNIEEKLNVLCKEAHTLQEAKEHISQNRFFLIISGVVLSDAVNGEVIEYLNEQKLSTIVLSGEKNNQSLIGLENVVEFNLKGESGEIDHLISSVFSFHRNRHIEVMTVSRDESFHEQIGHHCKKMYMGVHIQKELDEALEFIRDGNSFQVKLIFMDDSYESDLLTDFIKNVKEARGKRRLYVIIKSGEMEEEVLQKLFKAGLHDYLDKTDNYEIFSYKINNTLEFIDTLDSFNERNRYDYLTGLYTLPYFYELCETSYCLVKQEAIAASAAVIGVDNLNIINKQYGYITGNQIIQKVAQEILELTDESTIAARFGGDTFVLLDLKANENQLQMIYEALASKFASESVKVGDNEIDFTVSIGVYPYYGSSLEEMVEMAYSLLVKAKYDGKNRVVIDR